MSFTQKDRVELEELMQDFDRPVASSVMPRWQRKALRSGAGKASLSSSVVSSASACDVDLTGTKSKKRGCPGTPSRPPPSSPCKRSRVTKTPAKTPSATVRTRMRLLLLRVAGGSTAVLTHEPCTCLCCVQNDRFIPSRGAMDFDVSHFNLTDAEPTAAAAADGSAEGDSPGKAEYQRVLASSMLGSGCVAASDAGAGAGAGAGDSHRVLAFKNKAPAPTDGHLAAQRVLYSQNRQAMGHRKGRVHRHIPSDAERVLDAPQLVDDYYLNLLDWSSTNVLSIALGPTVYLWNASSGSIDELMSMPSDEEYISSVSWIEQGNILALGTDSGATQLWDVESKRLLRTMGGHSARVGAMSWNKHILSTGSRDSTIVNHDVRQRDHVVTTLRGHEQEVCGLKWSPDGQYLASGGNDNLLCVWEASASSVGGITRPTHKLTQHCAAVKALAWCPFQRTTLASGGGTADRTIKFWNASNGALLNSIDTGSQVCSLLWSQHEKEILSSHGYSRNQLCLWKYPSMAKIKELEGHSARVLHLAASPDGAHVCSAGADETLRYVVIVLPTACVAPSCFPCKRQAHLCVRVCLRLSPGSGTCSVSAARPWRARASQRACCVAPRRR